MAKDSHQASSLGRQSREQGIDPSSNPSEFLLVGKLLRMARTKLRIATES